MAKENKDKEHKNKNSRNSKIKRYKKTDSDKYSAQNIPTEYRYFQTSESDNESKNDREQAVTRDVISSKAKTAVIIMLICLVFVIIATSWNYLAPDKLVNSIQKSLSGQTGEDFPTFISGTKVSSGNFQYNGEYLTYVSDTSLICLNKSAGEVVNRPISFSQPAIKTAGENILTYNIDGTGYQYDTTGETKIKNELDSAIIQGDIADNGTHGFITKSDGYLSKLVVFDSSGSQIYSYSFSDYYATSLSINSNGTKAAVSTVTSVNGDFKTAIYILDFSSEEPAAILEENETLIYSCNFMDNGSIAAIGDTQALMIKSNYNDVERYNYDGLTLTALSFDDSIGGVITLSPSSDGGNCHIVYLNKNGSLQKIADTEYKINSVDLYGNKIAALCDGGKTVFFGADGQESGSADTGLDGQSITMYGENSVYVLGVTEIREASMN